MSFSYIMKKLGVLASSHLSQNRYMKTQISFLRGLGIFINGRPIYISPSAHFDNSDYSLISIGDQCVMSFDVYILTHDYSIARALHALGEDTSHEPKMLRGVSIGDNCFIGARSILCPGVEFGNNCIVGAGAVVRGGGILRIS